MAAANTDKWRKKRSNFSTTLSAGIDDNDVTISLTSVTGLPTDTAVELTINRVDADGNPTPNLMERVIGVISSNDLTVALRGQDNTTAKSHSNGAIVEDLWDADTWNDAADSFLVGHTQAGAHAADLALTTPVLTNPDIVTAINDANGNEVIKTPATSSAVNEITVTNAATGNKPKIAATGGDTNIDLELEGKGSGKVKIDASYGDIVSDTDQATITFDLSAGDFHKVTLTDNRTLALSNPTVGQKFFIRLLQDAGGTNTVTWFSTITWAGSSAPTLTTTGDKADLFAFVCTGSGTYDGFIVGQDIG